MLIDLTKLTKFFILTIVTFVPFSAAAQTPAGTTEFVRGLVHAQPPAEELRILKRNSPVHEGERLESGVRSFAVFAMRDGTRFTLRPSSLARVPSDDADSQGANPELFLEQGSLRGKFPPSDKQQTRTLGTPAGDIAFSSGEFTLRWCKAGCGVEATSELAGKALVLNGLVQTTDAAGKTRQLKPGGKLQVGDKIVTGPNGFVMVMFRDGSKVALQPGSDLTVMAFRLNPADPTKGRVHLKLNSGGGRFKTGTVGKTYPAGYKVFTPVVMTGVRGTGFDLVCVGSCATGAKVDSTNPDALDGLYTRVWEGRIVQSNDAGSFEFAQGESNYFADAQSEPVRMAALPPQLEPEGPHPGEFSVDSDYLFQMNANSNPPAGLYVQVHSGSAVLTTADGKKNEILEGSTAYMDPQAAAVVEGSSAPAFMGSESNCQ